MTNYSMKNILLITIICSLFACDKGEFTSDSLKIKIDNKSDTIKKVSVFLINDKDILSDSMSIEVKSFRKKTLKWRNSVEYSQGVILISIDDGEKEYLDKNISNNIDGDYLLRIY